jgi:hypothetical protein
MALEQNLCSTYGPRMASGVSASGSYVYRAALLCAGNGQRKIRNQHKLQKLNNQIWSNG